MRLIDADELKQAILELSDCENGFSDTYDKAHIIGVIDDQPSVEGKRKIAEWNCEFADNGWVDHICSHCGFTENTDIHVRLDWKFCPQCGYYMKGR